MERKVHLGILLVFFFFSFCHLSVARASESPAVHESQVTRVKSTGKSLVLRCPFLNDSVSWTKDDHPYVRRHNDLPFKFKNDSTVLHLDDAKEEDGGKYTCSVQNRTGIYQRTFIISVIRQLSYPPIILGQMSNKTVHKGGHVNFECPIKSDLQPSIRWLKMIQKNGSYANESGHAYSEELIHNGKTVNITNNRELLSLSNVTQDMRGWYVCLAENSIGKSYERAWLEVIQEKAISSKRIGSPDMKDLFPLLLSLTCLCLLIFVGIGLFVCFKKRHRVTLTKDGFGSHQGLAKRVINMHENILYSSFKGDSQESGPSRRQSRSKGDSRKIALDQKWEIPRHRIKISGRLGEGAFGVVMKAEIEKWVDLYNDVANNNNNNNNNNNKKSHNKKNLPVAVKMVKKGCDSDVQESLLQEVKVMMNIGQHMNVLTLVGCCTLEEPFLVVMEYAPHGNLRDFLRGRRPCQGSNSSSSTTTPIHSYPPNSTSNGMTDPSNNALLGMTYIENNDNVFPLEAARDAASLSSSSTTTNPPSGDLIQLTYKDLLSFSRQVAKGAEFLASKQCIHRDLAARNVLVGENFVLKVADFGLSRDVKKRDYYRKLSDGRLPVKWMAPESLFDNIYTCKSDIWSYGILLWEIFTLGGNPYPGIPVENLLEILKKGYRMEKPAYACQTTYDIMKRCWQIDPNLRPSFGDLICILDDAICKCINENYLELDPEMHKIPEKVSERNDEGIQ